MTTAAATTAGSASPIVADTRAALRTALGPTRLTGNRVVLVATMGALHAGHAALVSAAREAAGPDGTVVVSVFVNPLQFTVGEDLDRYPRTFEADVALAGTHGADVVFAPSVEEVYPGGESQVFVMPGPLGDVLEGSVRPGHFRGVLTVVAKLFGLVRPDIAVFGEKDYQQLVLVRRMAEDLCLGVTVVGAETVREPGGLALSSRNAYLDPSQREAATALSRALGAGAAAGSEGADAVLAAARLVLEQSPGVVLDYLALTSTELADPPPYGVARLLVAARVGTTRLIDNVAVTLGPPQVRGGHSDNGVQK